MPLIVASPPESRAIIFDNNGKPAPNAKLFFFDAGTTTPQITYTNAALSIPHAHPVVADSQGRAPRIYLLEGLYRIRVERSDGVLIYDDDNLQGSFQTTEQGEDPDVDPNGVAQTGDMKFRYDTAQITGWVRANGNTIGSATSGATERANADVEALFVFLWQKDSNLAVSGGRGASSAADWASNKTIAIPDFRGRVPVGLDTMGAAAAGRLTDATMSPDGVTLGASGGGQLHILSTAQLPAHSHPAGSLTVPPHSHLYTGVTGFLGVNFDGIAPRASNTGLLNTQSSPTLGVGGSTASVGSGEAHPNVQPSLAGTFYLKL